MSGNRKNRGREYGKQFKIKKTNSAVARVLNGRGSNADFNIAFDKFNYDMKRISRKNT